MPLTLLYLFVGALMIRLWYNFATDHPSAAFASDASEYLRYTEALSKLNWFSPVFGAEWKEFVITGPVFPFFLWFCSLVTGTTVSAANAPVFLGAHSIVSALTVVGIAVVANNLWGRKTALTAGFISALYPAFIVNSGRLYSESFATFIEVAALAILTNTDFIEKLRAKRLWLFGFLGVLLVVLQLTRSSMILMTGAAFAFVFASGAMSKKANGPLFKINWRAALINCAVLAGGCAAMLTPWLIFEKTAFDRMTLVVDRVGHYNLFVGTNSNIQGFLSYPYPDGRGIEQKSFLQLTKEAFKQSPSRFIKLMLDKPARLYKFPWNDFRTAIGPVSFKLQVAFHQLVILLALIGVALGLVYRASEDDGNVAEQAWLGKLALLATFVLNLPFLLFITVPRYNLMAMPALIILAAAGLQALIWLLRNQAKARAPKAVALSALFLFVFLRDDLRSPIAFGDNAATLYFVQGTELLTRSLLATIATLVLLAGLWLSLNLLKDIGRNKEVARVLVALLAVALLPLSLFPQRANGRMQEGIITLARPGESLTGTISLPEVTRPLVNSGSSKADWYLMIDSDLAQIPRGNLDITVNGKPLNGPAMPSLAALDDWHYLKFHKPGDGYLECGYIFDCLSREAALNNVDMRQWYLLPVPAELVASDTVTVKLTQKTAGKTSLYSAADHKGKGEIKQLIPSRAVYSWEKAFYGVENDEGLTCPRYDEVVAKRKAKWKIGFENKSEDLPIDMNVRLVKVKGGAIEDVANKNVGSKNGVAMPDAASGGTQPNAASGNSSVTLNLNAANETMVAVAVNLEYPKNNRIDANFPAQLALAPPALELHWRDKENRECKLTLPWLARPEQKLNVLVPLDLNKIDGKDFKIVCTSGDKDCRIELAQKNLNGHPLFSPQELY